MNKVAVEEELIQVNHTLKLVVGAHEEKRLYPRHLTKDGAIYSSIIPLYLLYSSMNKVAVEEELIQYE